MRIAIIGAGNVGRALGRGWGRAGHEIIFGVTNPAATGAVEGADVASAREAAEGADLVVLAVPWSAVPAAVAACGDLSGQLLIDVTNPVEPGTAGLELKLGFHESGGEHVARLAPNAKVVKTMNQVGFAVMDAAHGYPIRPVMFVAGDDDAAKATASALVEALGFEGRDAGPLDRARLLEPYAMLWIEQAILFGGPQNAAFGYMRKGPA